MAGNSIGDATSFVKWLGQKATARPIQQIEQTLNTGKPPAPKAVPASPGIPPSTIPKQRFRRYGPAAPASRLKAALTRNGGTQ